jgi:hypothetical protein
MTMTEQLAEALQRLECAEREYRRCHDHEGDGHIVTGRAWDRMRHAGDKARSILAAYEASKAASALSMPPNER